jgi:hypothetical protein
MAGSRLDLRLRILRRTMSSNRMDEERMTPQMTNQDDGNPTLSGTGQIVNLDDLAMRMLQRLVHLTVRGDGSDGHADVELNEMLRRACRAARHAGLHAEQLVIVLKDAWIRVPATARHQGRDVQAAFDRLVTLSIDEYYRAE